MEITGTGENERLASVEAGERSQRKMRGENALGDVGGRRIADRDRDRERKGRL